MEVVGSEAADTLGRFGKAHDHAGLWCREGVGGTGTLYAQHKEAAACSFREKVLLVLEWFVAQKVTVTPNSIDKGSIQNSSFFPFQSPYRCKH